MTDPVLDTMRGVGWISQVRLAKENIWVSWTQYTTQNGRTPDQARDLARTTVERLLADGRYDRGRVVREDWIVEEIIHHDPPTG